MEKIKLLTDNPLRFEDAKEKYFDLDGLEFKKYTDVLTNAIINTQTPFTIGIYGEWGKGKTSFLEMIKYRIDHDKKDEEFKNRTYVTVWFNAWKYEKDNDPIAALLTVISEAVEDKITDKKKDFFKTSYRFLRNAAASLLAFKTTMGTKTEKLQMSFDLLKNWRDAKDETEKENLAKQIDELIDDNSYVKVFDILEKLKEELVKKKIYLVIFIDDLDRCLPPYAVELLENIKLVLDLENFTFVMGIANDVVEGHLEHRYKEEFGIDKEKGHGKSYLEKIIQLPFYLPKFNKKFDHLVESLFAKVENGQKIENVKSVIESISEHKRITPRMLVRVINQAKIHEQIDKTLGENGTWDKRKPDFMFAVFVFVLLMENLYKSIFDIFQVERKSNFEKLKDLVYEYSKIIEENKDKEKRVLEFLKGIEIDLDSKGEFDEVLRTLKDDKNFRKLLSTHISISWLSDSKLREKTFEFIDEISGEDEDVQEEKIEKRIENANLDELKNILEDLNKKVVTPKAFQTYITKDETISYDNFIKVTDHQNKEIGWSKFLVTNFWYKQFIDKGGYKKEDYWLKEGWEFIQNNNINKPEYWENKNFNGNFQPVVGVSFYEAEAFCRYLTKTDKGGFEYSLPSKEQFEYIAGGGNEKRKYPWGNEYSNTKCNNDKINLNKTSIVGAISSGDNKDGICDMSGNVWKWTITKDKNNWYDVAGGSWDYNFPEDFRVSSSYGDHPGFRYDYVGFYLTRTKRNS